MTIKCVFFDLFGVYVQYLDNEIALNNIKSILADPELKERVFDFERGKVPCSGIYKQIVTSHPTLIGVDDWETADFSTIVRGADTNIVEAAKALRKHGIKVGMFCNNGYWTDKRQRSAVPDDLSLFDVVVESCRIGYRKSDPESYHIAAQAAGYKLEECVLVDDSSLNVQGAIREGMHGIHQKGEDSATAVKELEKLLGLKLLQN